MNDQLKKLALLKVDPTLALFDEMTSLNQNIEKLIEATESSKTEVVSIDNISDAQTDLSPLERNFEALRASMEGVKEAIQSMKPAQAPNMGKVEDLLTKLNNKEHKETDLSKLIDEVKKSREEEVSITLKII